MKQRNLAGLLMINIMWLLQFKEVRCTLVCSDIPPVWRVDCGIDDVDEAWCLNQGCCYEDMSNLRVPKCYYKADRRKILIDDVRNGIRRIQFGNKEYIISPDTFSRDVLDTHCADFGSEFKPAYINYNEEYEMLRLGMRRHFGIRNKAAYKEAWLGGSISQKHVTYYSRSNNYTRCPVLAYATYNASFSGRTVVLVAKPCTRHQAHGICDRQTGVLTVGMPLIYHRYEMDEECYIFTNNGNGSIIFNQKVTLNNVQNEFVLEIPIKGNISCSSVVFGLRRFSASCGSMYLQGSDCEMLETLPNEESCYVRCYCNNVCEATLIMNVERDEQEWALCPMSTA